MLYVQPAPLFGGVLSRAADSPYNVQRMVGGPAHDAALRNAVAEISPLFQQCPRCGDWVCKNVCWNETRNQCVNCSPKMEHQITAIESEGTIYQLRDKTFGQTDLTGSIALKSSAASMECPSCGAEVERGQKFCGECGSKVGA